MTSQIVSVTYSLQGRDPNEISSLWQSFQILFYICSMVSSLFVIFFFSDVIDVLHGNCVLKSYLAFIRKSDFTVKELNNISCSIDIASSKFDNSSCEIVMYIPVLITTLACFFTYMFITCGRGGAGRQVPDAWRIVIPTIVVNLFLFGLTIYAAIIFHSGVQIFLDNIKKSWGLHKIMWSDVHCLESKDKNIGKRLADGLQRVMECTWLSVIFCGFGLFWIILRLLFGVDFQLIKTTTSVDLSQKPFLKEKDFNRELIKDSNSDSSEDSFYTALSELSEETVKSPSEDRRHIVHFREVPSVYTIFELFKNI